MFRELLLLALCLLVANCGSRAPRENLSQTDHVGSATAMTAPEPDLTPLLSELTQAVRKFSAEQRRVPKSLDDLVAAGYLSQLPTAPLGKTFTINQRELNVTVK